MKKIKLVHNFAEYKINDKERLQCGYYGAEAGYSLRYLDYKGKYITDVYLVENKKRLSTINKKAREYGVEFVEEAQI